MINEDKLDRFIQDLRLRLSVHFEVITKAFVFLIAVYLILGNKLTNDLFGFSKIQPTIQFLSQTIFYGLVFVATLSLFPKKRILSIVLILVVAGNFILYRQGYFADLIRHSLLILFMFIFFTFILKISKRENIKALNTFAFLSFLIFVVLNLITDLNARFYLFDMEGFRHYSLERSQLLYHLTSIFVVVEFCLSIKENKVRLVYLFFSVSISLVYGLLFLFIITNYQERMLSLMQNDFNLLYSYLYLPHIGVMLFFILYHFNISKYSYFVSALVVFMAIDFGGDGLFGYNLIIGYLLIMCIYLLPELFPIDDDRSSII